MWGEEKSRMAQAILAWSEEDRKQLAIELLGAHGTGEQLIKLLCNAPDHCKEQLKGVLGGCGGACKTGEGLTLKLLEDFREANCYNRRLSILEENNLRSNIGGSIDIPTVAGANGVQTVTVDPYGVEYFLTSFSMDGEMSTNTGSLSKVKVVITHAGHTLADFRVSQYFKNSCCTTIVEQFRRRKMCFGWNSSWTITVTNTNTNLAETFINGVFSYTRGYPDPIKGVCVI